ncbi:methyltransferase domain-containing protein [Synechococcus sp. WH 8016]|uniref:class I SAM-dependent methyltransferase n=1 Tax=Synechococcus sp. WH 8016 TaxID=166318 RepID=UPI00131F35B4|nr:methyltransferase domain-containing protein [Synechococcus sp. WH 8016]
MLLARLPLSRSIASICLKSRLAESGSSNWQILNNLKNTRARYGDIIRGLPLPSGSVRQLYSSHVIEHLPLAATQKALRECHRLLASDGLFRLVVPNLRYFIDRYVYASDHDHDIKAAISFCLDSGMGSPAWGPLWGRIRGDRHHLMHDASSISSLLREAGFSDVRPAKYADSKYDFSAVETPERWCEPENIGFECRR